MITKWISKRLLVFGAVFSVYWLNQHFYGFEDTIIFAIAVLTSYTIIRDHEQKNKNA